MQPWRAQFDFDITFLNGGGLQGQGFRLDIPGATLGDEELGALLVAHLGLLMVDRVRISNKTFIQEPHKGSRHSVPLPAPGAAPRRWVDLSHPIEAGMKTYPGLPGPEISDHLSREASRALYAQGTEFLIGRISMVANTGTYLDSPFHRFAQGADLARLPLSSLAELEGVVVRLLGSKERAIDQAVFEPIDVRGKAVLVHTGWDRHWGTDAYGVNHPFLTAAAARWLVEHGAVLVGIDSVNIDDTRDGTRPAHSTLLQAGIPIVEHLCRLEQLPPTGFSFSAVPPMIVGFATFPVRAYASIR